MKRPQAWAVILLLTVALVLLLRRGDKDYAPPSQPLADLPHTIADWQSTDIPISQETLDVLGQGSFLNRVYLPPSELAKGATPENSAQQVSLFIGYFPTQRSGQSIHSPQHCLPGAGWTFETSGVTDVQGANGQPTPVGEYLITNGSAKLEVFYWYQAHGRTIANDYKAKFYMLVDSMKLNRSDAALVRMITPLAPGEDRNTAKARLLAFTNKVTPLLPAYIPD